MRRHKDALYRFARRYAGSPDAAFDIVQEAFVATWRALASYDARRPFDVWLRAIALNKCRDYARRRSVRRLILGQADPNGVEARRQADPAPGAEEDLLAWQRRLALDRAVASLPARLKEPLLLIYFEDMSQQEAAQMLGLSVKGVETRLYRARRRLAEILEKSAEFREG